jgi:hypothetical protein
MPKSIYEPELIKHLRARVSRSQSRELSTARPLPEPSSEIKLAHTANDEDLAFLRRATAPDTGNLISLALWLRKEAASTSRAAAGDPDPVGQQISLDAAARLERASEIVKAYADQIRKQRATEEDASRPKLA